MREIWEGSPQLAEVRRINEEAMTKRMSLGMTGGHCMGLAEMATGDPLAMESDPVDGNWSEPVVVPSSGALLPIIH